MDSLNAIVLLLNYLFVPALSYGSQLALGAIFVSLIYGILRFAYFTAGDLMSFGTCLLYTSPSPRDRTRSRMPSSA